MKLSVRTRWAAAAGLAALAMFSVGCSDDAEQSAAAGATDDIVAACLSVDGTLSLLDGARWTCDSVPVAEGGYDALTAHFQPFCGAPHQFTSGWADAENTAAGWSCWDLAPGDVDDPEAACALLGGAWEVADVDWTCRDIAVADDARYGEVEAIFEPLCTSPMELTSGRLSDAPPTAGWSCSSPAADATPTLPVASSLDEACAMVQGTLLNWPDGGWTCDEVALVAMDNYSVVETLLSPFCLAPMQFSSGLRSEDPPVAGFSCSNV